MKKVPSTAGQAPRKQPSHASRPSFGLSVAMVDSNSAQSKKSSMAGSVKHRSCKVSSRKQEIDSSADSKYNDKDDNNNSDDDDSYDVDGVDHNSDDDDDDNDTEENYLPPPRKLPKSARSSSKPHAVATSHKHCNAPALVPCLVDPTTVDKPPCLSNVIFVLGGSKTSAAYNASDTAAKELISNFGGTINIRITSQTNYLVVLGNHLDEDVLSTLSKNMCHLASVNRVPIVNGIDGLQKLTELYCNGFLQQPPPVKQPVVKLRNGPSTNNQAEMLEPLPPPMEQTDQSAILTSLVTTSNAALPCCKLWTNKYAPLLMRDILGNKDVVNKLEKWLQRWNDNFHSSSKETRKIWSKAVLLSGPVGVGKRTIATLAARNTQMDLVEYDVSNLTTFEQLRQDWSYISSPNSQEFSTPIVIALDRVDLMEVPCGGAIIVKMIMSSHVPVICICNDLEQLCVPSLYLSCYRLKVKCPLPTVIASQAVKLAAKEGYVLGAVEQKAIELFAQECNSNIGRVLVTVQIWILLTQGTLNMSSSFLVRTYTLVQDDLTRLKIIMQDLERNWLTT